MTRKERQEARAERYRQFAEKADKRATAAFNASSAAVENIPLGQPILVGHHSEKAAYYRQKAEAVENNDNIYLGDDDAVERLEEKIAELSHKQEQMKATNKIVRSKKSDEEKIAELIALGFSHKGAENVVTNGTVFPAYMLTNNNARINAAKKQLAKAKSLATKEDREYEAGGLNIEDCYSENRVRIYFPGKPDNEMRAKLKRNGFRWAPSMGCWQAYINRWTLDLIKDITKSNQ